MGLTMPGVRNFGLIILAIICIAALTQTFVPGGSQNFKAEATPRINEAILHEAKYWEKLPGNRIQCQLCFRKCVVEEGQRGFCRNKVNIGGKYYTLVYGLPCAVQVDPIEKEPQFHMLPGSKILCIGTASCNFRCKFCHNWHMSQRSIDQTINYRLSPEDIVKLAKAKGIPTISFTYNEPIVFYEYMLDIAKLAKSEGIRILFHSNGSMAPQPLRELLKYTDAATIDLKAFTPEFYARVSSAKLEPVLESLKIIKEKGVHLEIVNLIVPTLNDDPRDIGRMCQWIKEHLGDDVPLHFSRFFPAYRLSNLPPTPVKTLEEARRIATDAGLKYVTVGNLPGHKYNSTYCPECGRILIRRIHFTVLQNNVEDGRCKFCGQGIPGIWH